MVYLPILIFMFPLLLLAPQTLLDLSTLALRVSLGVATDRLDAFLALPPMLKLCSVRSRLIIFASN